MNKLIARLINCGMTRDVALFMYGKYKRAGELDDFERYVESVEDSQREQLEAVPAYSFAPAPSRNIELNSDSDFARAVDGREQGEALPIINELMGTLQILYQRLYNAVMVKLS